METPFSLVDRRWKWRVVVLTIVLVVVGLLAWRGFDLMTALALTLVIFIVADKAIGIIIDSPAPPTAPPAGPTVPRPGPQPVTGPAGAPFINDVTQTLVMPAPAGEPPAEAAKA